MDGRSWRHAPVLRWISSVRFGRGDEHGYFSEHPPGRGRGSRRGREFERRTRAGPRVHARNVSRTDRRPRCGERRSESRRMARCRHGERRTERCRPVHQSRAERRVRSAARDRRRRRPVRSLDRRRRSERHARSRRDHAGFTHHRCAAPGTVGRAGRAARPDGRGRSVGSDARRRHARRDSRHRPFRLRHEFHLRPARPRRRHLRAAHHAAARLVAPTGRGRGRLQPRRDHRPRRGIDRFLESRHPARHSLQAV